MKTIGLKKSRDASVRRRHPWIFSGAVASEPDAAPGETVEVVDAAGERLGYGAYAPASPIRVRMVSFGAGGPPGPAQTEALVAEAIGRRAAFFADAYTDAIRLVNAESDGLPGVVADFYAGWAVCQFTSPGAEAVRGAVAAALMAYAPGCRGVCARDDADARAREGLPSDPPFAVLAGDAPPDLVEIGEGPCRFLVDVRRGHKTGFYLDQRDARRLAGSFANGRDVLNCFSYSGGFGLFARAAGASKVVNVDVSQDALALARRNEALVHLCGTEMEYVAADVFAHLRACRDAGRTYDMVVLDPPKFAATKGQVMKAARGYKDINLLAMKLLRPDGVLATFSCSGAVDETLFDKILAGAAEDAGRAFQVVARTGQPADHPVALSFPEGRYLKGVVLRRIA